MRQGKAELFVHLVWATWDRMFLITPELEPGLYAALQAECVRLGVEVIALGGAADHVHLLARLPATLAVADLAKQVKGASSHFVTHVLERQPGFKWQGAYAAYSVSPADVPRIRDYVRNQKRHHRDLTLDDTCELP